MSPDANRYCVGVRYVAQLRGCALVGKETGMKKFLSLCLALILLVSICGCAPLIIGAAAGGLGAYAVSKDTVQGDTDKNYEALWSSALSVAGV